MSKSLISQFILPVILLGLSIGTAFAALQCGTQPSCADLGYSKASLTGCADIIYCPFDTSYKKCVTPKSADDQCGAYGLNSCPANANCDYCATAYKIVGCDSGYTLTNNTCVCATSCANKISQSSIPANATATTQSCTACGVTSNIIVGWKCNTGYTQIGARCELATSDCESAGLLSQAVTNANCDSHTIYLTNGTQKTCYSNCSCKDGFTIVNNACVEE